MKIHYRYLPAPKTKDHKKIRRLRKSTIPPIKLVELENIFSEISQKAFLSSSYNNQKLIDLPVVQLEADHQTIVRSIDNADTVVVSSALDHTCAGRNVEIIAADTDLMIMLIYFWKSLMGEITIKSETTKNHKTTE